VTVANKQNGTSIISTCRLVCPYFRLPPEIVSTPCATDHFLLGGPQQPKSRQICLEAERACDDAVVISNERTAYAEQLVNLAKRLTNTLEPPVLSMANRSDLSRRVSAILDQHQARGRAGTRWTVATLIVTALLASAIAPGLEITRTYAGAAQTQNKKTTIKNKALNRALVEAADDGNLKDVEELLAGHAEIVDLLLNSGARVNEIVEGDENALIKASGSGHVEVVRLLLSRGADVNVRVWSGGADAEWRTALKMARKGGHLSVVQLLTAAGARE